MRKTSTSLAPRRSIVDQALPCSLGPQRGGRGKREPNEKSSLAVPAPVSGRMGTGPPGHSSPEGNQSLVSRDPSRASLFLVLLFPYCPSLEILLVSRALLARWEWGSWSFGGIRNFRTCLSRAHTLTGRLTTQKIQGVPIKNAD